MKPYKHHSRCAKSIRGDACDMPVDCARMNDRRDDSEHQRDMPPTLWRASRVLSSDPSKDSEPMDLNAPSGSIFVLGHHPVTWADVKKFAWRVFRSDDVRITRASEGSPEFELRWTGSGMGPYPDRRMQVRAWRRDWEDL
jgi:hypothetical protein